MFYIITIFFILIGFFEIRKLVKDRIKKELLMYLIIMTIAIYYSYGALLKWNLPRPGKVISQLYEPISNYVFAQTKHRTKY